MTDKKRPGAIFTKRVTPNDIDRFRNTVKDAAALADFMSTPHAIRFMKAVGSMDEDGLYLVGRALAAPRSVSILAENGQAMQAWYLIRAQPKAQQTAILAAADATFSLARAYQANSTLTLIGMLSQRQQAVVLAAPNAVFGLARFGRPDIVLDMILKQPQEQRALILAAPHAVYGLARFGGKTAQTLTLVQSLTQEQQTAVYAAQGAIFGLNVTGRRDPGDDLRDSLPKGPADPKGGHTP